METTEFDAREFGLNLMMARKRAGLTQDELAAAADVPPSSITRYENATCAAPLDKVFALARALGVSIDDLAGLPQKRPRSDGAAGDAA